MNLTGKCKVDFWRYLANVLKVKFSDRLKFLNEIDNIDSFITPSMQYGVYVDFFDSVDIYVTEIPNWGNGVKSFRIGFHILKGCVINSLFLRPSDDSPLFNEYESRTHAIIGAIEKANEIYNLNNKEKSPAH